MEIKTKKGYMLLKVVITMSVFSILFLFIATMHLYNLKMEKDNYELYKKISYMEALKNEIVYNMTSEEIEKLKNEDSKYGIDSKNIKIDNLKQGTLQAIGLENVETSKCYIKIIISDKESDKQNNKESNQKKKFYNINIEMHNKGKCYNIEFEKGGS